MQLEVVSAIREKTARTVEDTLRNPFSVDIDKILHNVVYNRYVDKTQVFSFYKNDDYYKTRTACPIGC